MDRPTALDDDVASAIHAIRDATTALDKREPTDPYVRILRWQAARAALDDLTTIIDQMGGEAVNAMVELDLDRCETLLGPVYTEPGYAREEWDGQGVLNALPHVVDRDTGVIGVPLDVLEQVIPAVAPGKVSSKWSVTGLKKVGVYVNNYRRREPAPLVIRRGEPRR